ncbi:hypothetical protein HPULCUR_001772 [Helicostylum pulchrum]|uniref:Protein kinase domain-containing protein n=1 Tax=Helicostylum pulchrum TaxID=562976 RepID=A0ABP9XQ55_9FUNG
MISSPRNSVTHNQQAKLAVDYNELLKELSSHEMTSVGCYTIGETIGEGTFGKVKKGFHKLTGRLVAIKKISKQHAPMMAREIHHHRQLKHPNIVMLYEMITTESAIHIISEYCPNGDLLDALTDAGRCSEIRVHKWFRQLTDAIKYCHTRGIVHRDLKLENILLDAEDNVKICDFGFARFTQKNQYLETFCGSLSYSAPETDIWSLGVILFTLLAGEYPFDDDSEIMTQRKIVQVEYEMPFYFSAELSNLIRQMLQLEPSQRITIDNIVDHPWTTQDEVYSDNDNDDDNDIDEEEEEEEEEEADACLTPSSSTTTNQSTSDVDSIFSQQDINTIALDDNLSISPDLKFSPQVRSSLGILRPSQQQLNNKSSRFSAPTLNRRSPSPSSPLLQHSFRTSLPSSFHKSRDSGVFHNDTSYMSPIEQRLFVALTAAGFDKDALIKMQTGECDTSSTLWHLLLENMSTVNNHQKPMASVPDAFACAIESRNRKIEKHSIDRAIQTGNVVQTSSPPSPPIKEDPIELRSNHVQPYPKPVMNRPQNTIHTVGFGSTTTSINEKAGWFSSVKSWFGSKQQQQQLEMMQKQNEFILKHQKQQQRGRSSSNCSTMSSPISSPSSYRNFDTETSTAQLPEAMMMSPPIYRTGSQKYRRRVLQLSQPPVSELDKLTYNGTYSTNTINTSSTESVTRTCHYHSPQPQIGMHHVNMPPTALTTRSLVADSFSILNSSSQAKEVDICEKRYSMMYKPQQQQQPTPPPSPPTTLVPVTANNNNNNDNNQQQLASLPGLRMEEQVEQQSINNLLCTPISPMEERIVSLSTSNDTKSDNHLSDFSSDSSDDCSSISDCEEDVSPVPNTSVPAFEPYKLRSNRFEFVPRSRLSVYGMQESRSMGAKAIIEEEEEEDE